MDEELLSTARTIQNVHYKTLDGTSFDLIASDELNKFSCILSYYMRKHDAEKLSQKIIQNGSDLTYRIIIVHCIVDGKLIYSPVIRVKKDSGCVFYDDIGREYCNWNDYLCNNKLPKGKMIFPKNGSYSQGKKEVQLDTQNSPSAQMSSEVSKGFYVAAEVVSLVALVLPMFSFAKPYATGITAASAISNGYKAGFHGYQLYDRYKHGQSVHYSDDDAMFHWSHIGNSFLCYGLTHYRSFYGNPSPGNDLDNFLNLTTMIVKEFSSTQPHKAWNILKYHMINQHMLYLYGDLENYLAPMLDKVDFPLLVRGLRNFLSGKSSAYRKLLNVDNNAFCKVLQDVEVCKKISSFKLSAHELAGEKENSIVSKIVEEANSWELSNLSDYQLKFRVSSICQYGQRAYETVEECCRTYGVGSLREISVNDKRIFENIGENEAELERLLLSASKQFPQLLSYAVEFAKVNHHVNWNSFKPYFMEKILEDCAGFRDCRPSIPWVNVLTCEEITRCNSGDNIYFARPCGNHAIQTQDLINLGKKLLGIISCTYVDILVANPDCEWTVMISKKKKRIVCIGPKISGKDIHVNGCYLVFVKPLQ